MADGFEAALPFVLRWEGGFVDHPDDPGGATNRGVTQKVYDAWRAGQHLPARGVRELADDELQAIYRTGYWQPPHCDLLAAPLALVQFDTAVNMGCGRAVRFLQQALGCGVDGQFGDETRRQAQACDAASTVAGYCQLREGYYRRLVQQNPRLSVFLKGWLNRLNALRAEAGVPGAKLTRGRPDFGDTGYIARVPDVGEDRAFDVE